MEIEKINKYHNGKVYTIRSPHTDKIYIGSTCQPLHKRFYKHKNKLNTSSKEIVLLGDSYIELLEDIKCENRNQLHKREGELIRENILTCVNKCIAGRTAKEYRVDNNKLLAVNQKKWKDVNKKNISDSGKQYREQNKDKLTEKRKAYQAINKAKLTENINCDCGGKYQHCRKSSHFKTNRHKTHFNIV